MLGVGDGFVYGIRDFCGGNSRGGMVSVFSAKILSATAKRAALYLRRSSCSVSSPSELPGVSVSSVPTLYSAAGGVKRSWMCAWNM